MTESRMGNRISGKRRLAGRRAWLTGTLAVGVVAASGAGAFAAMQDPTEQTGTTTEGAAPIVTTAPVAAPAQDCVALDAQSMRAIFEAWLQQGGGFRPGTLGRDSFRPGRYKPGSLKTKTFMFGGKPATVELSKLHLTACPNEGVPTDAPTTAPTGAPTDAPTAAPVPTETNTPPAPPTEAPAPPAPPTEAPAPPAPPTVAPAPPAPPTQAPVPSVTSTAS